jgi:SNF2 family DNA or RNA helicase
MSLGLYPFQLEGAQFLIRRRFALLADDMGLGKTPQAIAASDAIEAHRILVICPGLLCRMWAEELPRWRRVPVTVTRIATSRAPIPAEGAVVLSYDMAVQPGILEQLLSFSWQLLICDEAHFLKGHDTQRTRAVLGKSCDGVDAIAGSCDRAWFLTGTPICNHPGDLFPIMRLCGAWSSGYGRFLSSFCYYSDHPRYGLRIKPECRDTDSLKSLLRPMMLRRLKNEVEHQLPSLTISELVLEPRDHEFPEYLRSEYPEAVVRLERAAEAGDWSLEDDPHVASVRRLIGLAKALPLAAQLRYELESGLRKVVVFGLHRAFLHTMLGELQQWHPGILHGGTTEARRQAQLSAFQDGDSRVLLLQTKVASTGLTLTAADNVVIGEPSWAPADNMQAIMRVHRIGQRQPVMARFATLTGTIDEPVNRILQRKSQEIATLLS